MSWSPSGFKGAQGGAFTYSTTAPFPFSPRRPEVSETVHTGGWSDLPCTATRSAPVGARGMTASTEEQEHNGHGLRPLLTRHSGPAGDAASHPSAGRSAEESESPKRRTGTACPLAGDAGPRPAMPRFERPQDEEAGSLRALLNWTAASRIEVGCRPLSVYDELACLQPSLHRPSQHEGKRLERAGLHPHPQHGRQARPAPPLGNHPGAHPSGR